MAKDEPTFDPAGAISFDLERGRVELRDGEAQLLLPAAAIAGLLSGEGGARALGAAIGVSAIGRAAARISARGASRTLNARDLLRAAPLEKVVELLGGELSLLGFGSLRVERWGEALLFVIDPCTLDQRADELISGIVEGALESVAERPVTALVVDRSAESVRVLVGNAEAIAKASELCEQRAFFTEIISMLHEGAPEPGR